MERGDIGSLGSVSRRLSSRGSRPGSAAGPLPSQGVGSGRSGRGSGSGAGGGSGRPHSAAPTSAPFKDKLLPKNGDAVEPERYCTQCRGPHDPKNVHNSAHNPFTNRQRYDALGYMTSLYLEACNEGTLPARLDASRTLAIAWKMPLVDMSQEDYDKYLPLFLHGVREQHAPYRTLAFRAVEEMLAAGGGRVEQVCLDCPRGARFPPPVVEALRTGLNTKQPAIVAAFLHLIGRMLECEEGVGPALVPHYKHLLPAINLFRASTGLHIVPPAGCIAATGRMNGGGLPTAPPPCNVCGKAVEGARKKVAQPPGKVAPVGAKRPPPKEGGTKYVLGELVQATLERLDDLGGELAFHAIKRYIPTYTDT